MANSPPVRDQLVGTLWGGLDPYAGFAFSESEVDIQGWMGSRHPWLEAAILELRPRLIVEIGVWKGASALHMAELLQRHGIDGVVIAVDTWLGSVEHWRNPAWFDDLRIQGGRPTIQRTFMNNVVSRRLQDHVLPLPLDSANAAALLGSHGLDADLIHLDAGHGEQEVAADLSAWWPHLRAGGILIGDDYHPQGLWPGVKAAFHTFIADQRLHFDTSPPKIRLRKPEQPVPASVVVSAPKELPETLDYIGEFGPELVLFTAFCCWLSKAGLLRRHRIRTYRGMRCFYEDLDCLEIIEKDEPRHYVPPQNRPAWLPVRNEHDFDRTGRPARHFYPDLRTRFATQPLPPEIEAAPYPLLIIHNKHNNEWGAGPVNHIPLATLEAMFDRLKQEFTVVYVRHGIAAADPGFSDDHNTTADFEDAALLDRHPEILSFEALYAAHCAAGGMLDLNRFKNALYSRCYRFISSQGGGAHHIALFSGSLLVVLHRVGQEVHWAYGDGYYGFMSQIPPIRAICRNDADLLLALGLFAGTTVTADRLLPAPGAASLLTRLSPWRFAALDGRRPRRLPNFARS